MILFYKKRTESTVRVYAIRCNSYDALLVCDSPRLYYFSNLTQFKYGHVPVS